jgi:NAD(P)-dependent dehydrogenase (short-subunit alcohol dehydrogenase family)
MTRLLEDKIAVVIGASRGIGAATARTFAEAGAAVVLAARNAAELDALAAEIASSGGEALAVPTDVTDPAGVPALVERTLAKYDRLDLAFNNAGHGHQPVPLAQLEVDDFDQVIAVNVRGVFLAMKFEIAAMVEGGGGSIVNMSSTAGLRGVRGIAAYVAGKHAIIGLTRTAALEYADAGIRVNVVALGRRRGLVHHRGDDPDRRRQDSCRRMNEGVRRGRARARPGRSGRRASRAGAPPAARATVGGRLRPARA